MNAYGGSELYHYELLMGLSKFKDLDIVFATATEPDLNFHLFQDLINQGIYVTSLNKVNEKFDLIIASQPGPNSFLCQRFPDTPKISIVHSALRSEDAVKHDSIKHYIAVQPDIYRCLKNQYDIKTKNMSLYYNPIDDIRFKPNVQSNIHKGEGETGVLIGEINDSLRQPMIKHLVGECIKNNIKLTIISRSKYDFNNDLIKVIDPCYNTEEYLKYTDFTAGIGGRTTIEGWLCGLPSYIYKVNPYGDILDIQLKYPPKIKRFKRDFVAQQHYNLYNKIINE
jgi:hypothetical protein